MVKSKTSVGRERPTGERNDMNNKAVLLLSGGLDSTLAAKLMLELGIELTALNFTSPFCTCTAKSAGCQNAAKAASDRLGLPIRLLAKGPEYLEIVKNPPHGYGRGMNPCVDCRIFILRKAAEFMEEIGASFAVTGEVVGQRPMSQRRRQLEIIERESGLEGRVLRPLSAKLLPETLPEKAGIVDRKKLLSISGRSRKEQIAWADEHGVADYPCPGGGCLLTDPNFAGRLRDFLDHDPEAKMKDLLLLKFGRHFRLGPRVKAVLGKNRSENERLLALSPPSAWIVERAEGMGPTLALLARDPEGVDDELLRLAGTLVLRYSKDLRPGGEAVLARRGDVARRVTPPSIGGEEELARLAV